MSSLNNSEPLVQVRSLRRTFENVQAVKDVSFDIHQGQVVGFIGANGAGKTTTMRIMATLDMPTSGSVTIGGKSVTNSPEKVRPIIGWMPDHYGSYSNMNVFEYLDFFARAYGLKAKERRERVEEVMDFADLTVLADRPMNKLSKGMGQRLCFGRMLLPDPEFLILDEPAAGLDPKARMEFKNLVRILAERGKTLFISSHILSELGEMCDSLLFIDAGKVVYHGDAESLKRGVTAGRTILDITVLGAGTALVEWASVRQGWAVVEERRDGARLAFDELDPSALAGALRQMVADGMQIIEFRREERRLEDAFVDILRQKAS